MTGEYCDTNNEVGDSYGDGECATSTNYGSRVGHSRGASQVSSCEPSVCRMSGSFCLLSFITLKVEVHFYYVYQLLLTI